MPGRGNLRWWPWVAAPRPGTRSPSLAAPRKSACCSAHPRIDFRPCSNPGKKVQKIREQNHRRPLDCSKNIFITRKVLIYFSSKEIFYFRNFFSDLEIGETFKKDTRDTVIRDQKYCNIFFGFFLVNLNKAYTFAEINSWMR